MSTEKGMNYNELVNPTFATGQATLEMLAAAGNPDAITYKETLGIGNVTKNLGGNANSGNRFFNPEEGRALMMGVTLGVEARYAAVTRLLKESGSKTVLDIASGYTPRALMCHREGIDYIGLDLPAVVDKMGPLCEKLIDKGSHPTYIAGDATNVLSIKQAADQLDGELFISTEGLLTYLNKSELEQLILGIRQVLLEHGGAWYTSDMGVQYDHFSAVAINNPDALERFAKAMIAVRQETTVYFFPISFASMEEKIAFFEDRGLHVELVPFYTEDTQLNILYGFDADGQERMKNLMKSCNMWKMTVADKKTDEHHQKALGLDIQYQHSEDTLEVALNGRLDTLGAPELMELFDTMGKEGIKRLCLDLKNLEYLSSAGLRVLLMMAGRLGKENMLVDNANAVVREIFETTGFSDAVTVQ